MFDNDFSSLKGTSFSSSKYTLPKDNCFESLNVSSAQKERAKEIVSRFMNGETYEGENVGPIYKDLKQLDQILTAHMSYVSPQEGGTNLKSTYGGAYGSYGTIPNRDLLGFEPAGSLLKRIFPRMFQLHAFLADSVWAASKARQELWMDTDRDGWVLVANEGVSKKRIKFVHDILEDLNYTYLRNKLRDDLVTYGNFLVKPKQNVLGGVMALEPLNMGGVAPFWSATEDKIIEWQYVVGERERLYKYSSLDHVFTYSSRSNTFGTPAMFSIVVDIEAALHASVYNNTLMQKGGLIKAILALDSLDKSGLNLNDQNYLQTATELTNWFSKNFGGVRNAGRLVVAPYLKNVFDLGKIGEMDSAWQHMVENASIKTSLKFGIDPRRLGVPLKSQYENKDQVADAALLSTDNNLYFYQRLVDDYMNRKLREFGITDVKVEASGEFNSLTKTAAEIGHLLAQTNSKVMTVDEFRKRCLRMEGLGGELGEAFIGDLGFEALKTGDESKIAKALGSAKTVALGYADLKLVRHQKKYIPFY